MGCAGIAQEPAGSFNAQGYLQYIFLHYRIHEDANLQKRFECGANEVQFFSSRKLLKKCGRE
jgi:hypothetical protein